MQNMTDLTNFGPTDEDSLLAREVYTRFKQYPGSQHIATEFALGHLSALMRLAQPKSVLEIGAGIGTQTYLLAAHPQRPSVIVATETNDFCIDQLGKNIPTDLGRRFVLVTGDEEIPVSAITEDKDNENGDKQGFDLIVMDVDAPERLFRHIKHGSYLFVEGNRRELRGRVQDFLRDRGLEVEFTNYNRGTRPIELIFKPTKYWFRRPKIRFNKIVKGCWIGQVSKKQTT